jgi:hypothetical protein
MVVVMEELGGDGGSDRVSYSPRAQIEAQLIPALLGDAALVEDDVEYLISHSPGAVWTFPITLFRYLRWQ